MFMTYVVKLERLEARPIAVVRRRAAPQELSKVVPDACGGVWNVIRSQKVSGAGRHVAVYLDDQINVEVGVELDGPFTGHGEVVVSETPAGLVATTTHYGPYGQLHEAHEAICRWCKANGHVLAGPNWEVYGHWNDEWNSDPTRICTNVFYLLVADGGSASEQLPAPDRGGS
jgi:effector-binding domain-containing protein